MSSTTCPVFRPSLEEFGNFYSYMSLIELQMRYEEHGICKVIPPDGWFSRSYKTETLHLEINNPVKQVVTGRAGVYNVNLFDVKKMTIPDFLEYDQKNYCIETYDEIERKFWKSMGSSSAWDDPIYGADMVGSLFNNEHASSWNVHKIDSLLRLINCSIPGVNSAMLYVGTWRSMFAFHVEDMNLYSINYVHTGSSKSWYSIHSKDRHRFESLALSYFGIEHKDCKEFLRHKTTLFSPQKLKEYGIQFSTAVQLPGEFIITFPSAYHAGFNHGYNIAEATNFATLNWIPFGKVAKSCVCRPLSVRLNADVLEALFARQFVIEGESNYVAFDGLAFFHNRQRCFCKKSSGHREIFVTSPCPTQPNGNNDAVSMDSPMDELSVVNAYTCRDCHTTCHQKCLWQYYPHLKDTLLCDICNQIASGPTFSSVSNMSSNASTVGAVDTLTAAAIARSPVAKRHNKTHSPGSEVNASASKKRSNSSKSPVSIKIKKNKVETVIKIGYEVSAVLPGLSAPVLGVVSDVEDGFGRVHIKGTRKDNDLWIPLVDLFDAEIVGPSEIDSISSSINIPNVSSAAAVRCGQSELSTIVAAPENTVKCNLSSNLPLARDCNYGSPKKKDDAIPFTYRIANSSKSKLLDEEH